jgi:hypothetical protein
MGNVYASINRRRQNLRAGLGQNQRHAAFLRPSEGQGPIAPRKCMSRGGRSGSRGSAGIPNRHRPTTRTTSGQTVRAVVEVFGFNHRQRSGQILG